MKPRTLMLQVVGTWNNLNNQRHGVYRALVTSIELGLTLVLPPWHINCEYCTPHGAVGPAPVCTGGSRLAHHDGGGRRAAIA